MRWLHAPMLGVPLGLLSYALLSHLLLLAGATIPAWVFPACLAGGLLAGCTTRPPETPPAPAATGSWHRVVPWAAAALLGAALALSVYGSLASTDRDWDGLVAWTLKARHLVPPVHLDQPYFQDPAVHAQGVGYPLLQPLCLGALHGLAGELYARLMFPVLYALSAIAVGYALLYRGVDRTGTWLGTLAFALTPMWLNRGAGAVDSGYAELFLVYATLVTTAGLASGDARLVAAGMLFLPLLKPEGGAYALLFAAVIASLRAVPRRLHYAGAAGATLGLLLWLPLRPHGAGEGVWVVLGPLLLFAGLAGLAELARRVQPRTLAWVWVGTGAVTVVTAYLCGDLLRGSSSLVLRDFVANLGEPGDRLRQLPAVIAGVCAYLVGINQYGLLFVLAAAALLLPRRWTGRRTDPLLGILLACGVATACLAMLLSPDRDLDHVFRSRFDRLLLHWSGIGWLLVAGWVFAPEPAEEVRAA